MHSLADGSSIPNRRIRFMQKPCRFEPIQLAFVFSFLLFSCAAPNYRVDISFDEGISYFRALKNVDDISLYYSNFEEERLERSSCYFSNGVFRAEHHNNIYSNSRDSSSIFVEYKGSSKEEFLKKCISLDKPKSFFSYNDLYPYVQKMAEDASSFYGGYDLPKEDIYFDINKGEASFVPFSSFLEKHLPKKKFDGFLSSDSLFLNASFTSTNTAYFYLKGETNSEEMFTLNISPK